LNDPGSTVGVIAVRLTHAGDQLITRAGRRRRAREGGGDAPGLVASEEMRRRAPPRFILAIA
jgi:hypothetical protein